MEKNIVILGAGLSGLTTAYLLQKEGFSVKILEANTRLGGRIYTKKTNNANIELGATWLWKYNTALIQLCKELDIQLFEQKMDGDALFEAMNAHPPQRFNLPPNQEISYRIVDGTHTIIEKLAFKIGRENIYLDEKVTHINQFENQLTVTSKNKTYEVDYVISTVPPRLLIQSITFSPELPKDVITVANQTHTWMKDSIKFAIVFDTPFWRKNGLSGVGFSNVGPFTELYDHCTVQENGFALMGFLNGGLAELTKEQREAKVILQLKKFFGEQVNNYLVYDEKIWKKETLTCIHDNQFIFPHQNNGHEVFQDSFMNHKLYISGTETSKTYGGYMEGAVRRAIEIVQQITKD
ncbi:flavin monoamine oxidase family protein [Tenacibaculum jejuense]|uniref:Amine oxidase, flavin-containing n=1 Tax=Tenacibaculum jejuense TaxID=584609 RepID=A0A238UAJ9_9FLAO|nr:NAD(P)/FAD-dependent oxidoreductase [Tenacibaculum jejuense]SNR15504.1 Amine oxidase, flavin-containing [Tenacibaculum jejuense]